MNYAEGDLIALALKGGFDVIVHGCNCFCTMGAGIAFSIQNAFPEAFAADLATNKGDRHKLGSYSHATVIRNSHELTIINGYTQFHYQGDATLVDYDAIRQLFRQIQENYSGKRSHTQKLERVLLEGTGKKSQLLLSRN